MPRLCFGCNARLYRGEKLLCTRCRNQIPLTDFNFTEENIVDRAFYGRIYIEKAASFLYYYENGMVKNLIGYLKYKNQETIGIFLGDWMGKSEVIQDIPEKIDMVVPVPLHPKKLRQRGYNQVEKFGQRLAFHLNADYVDHILIKTANTRTQTKKSRIYRWQGSRELYTLTDTQFFKGKKVLLVDDVITTGATIEACAKALHQTENISIYVATMAVVP